MPTPTTPATARVIHFPRSTPRARRSVRPAQAPAFTADALLAERAAVIRELGNDHRACAALIRKHDAESFEAAVSAEARCRLGVRS